MRFEDFRLNPLVAQGLADMGYETPTPIQREAIPHALVGRDVMGLAQTGTGKTAAFALPILERLLRGPKGRCRALVLAPTRELAEQIHEAFQGLGRHTGIKSASVYGGVGMGDQRHALKGHADVIVACPGRLLDHLGRRSADLSSIEILVLDEADRMLDMGFLPDIRDILSRIPHTRQTMLFSATMPDSISTLARETMTEPVTIKIDNLRPLTTVSHAAYPVREDRKSPLLLALLKQIEGGSVLIFARTKNGAKRLATRVINAGHSAACLQGNLSQAERKRALEGFRDGRYRILVATDIAARGLDISEITHVINYDMPDTPDSYTHRIGRTGRAASTGDAFTIVAGADERMLREIERSLGWVIERRTLPGFDYGTSTGVEFARRAEPFARPAGGPTAAPAQGLPRARSSRWPTKRLRRMRRSR